MGGVALFVYLLVLPNNGDITPTLNKQLLYYLVGMRCPSYIFTGALWFLTALFSTSIMGYYAAKYSIKVQILVSVLCTSICTFIGLKSIIWGGGEILPMNLDAAIFMLPIYLLGKNYNLISQYLSFSRKRLIISFLVLISVVAVTYLFTPGQTISYHKGQYGFAPLSLLATLSGIYIMWNLAVYINNLEGNKLKFIFSWIGANSMTFYIIHQQFILHPLNSLNLLVSIPVFHGIIRFVICLVVSYSFTLFANKYMKWSFK